MKSFTTIFIVLFTLNLFAQTNYSFISDKKFQGPEELLGYSFTPNVLIYPDKEDPDDSDEVGLAPEDIIFRISRNYLLVESEEYKEYKGAYSVNSINPTEYGYKISLMNAQNPSIQGHMKIILNKFSEVDAYIFKPSNKMEEVIFYQAKMPEHLDEIEKGYFTDIDDIQVTDTTLWYSTIYPFFEVDRQQRRLTPADSVSIYFDVDTVVTNAKKNKIRIDRSIVLRYIATDEDGFENMETYKFPVDKMKEQKNPDPNATNARYRVEFDVQNLKAGKVLLFLDQNRFINKIIVGDVRYTMRGMK